MTFTNFFDTEKAYNYIIEKVIDNNSGNILSGEKKSAT